MDNKRKILFPTFISLAIVVGMFIGYKVSKDIPDAKGLISPRAHNTLNEIDYLIDNKYVDAINEDSIVDQVASNLLTSLDPHSIYIKKQYVPELNQELRGRFGGIGIEFTIIKDTAIILRVQENGPAFKTGLLMGDKIIKVDTHTLTLNHTAEDIKTWVRGELNTKVSLTILRAGKTQQFSIIRNDIPIKSVSVSTVLKNNIGYIKIDKFMGETVRDFITALTTLKQQNINTLVLDLRDNGGGFLDAAVDIADEFLSDDKLIVYTKGNHIKRKEYRCRRKGLYETGKLIVLINHNSASASEVLTGALQDWERATIIGEPSFGKGLVQEQFELSNGAAVRLTIAKYYTPSGRCVQKNYIHNNLGIAEYKENQPNIKFDTFKTLNGKIVLGGMGIYPDILINKVNKNHDTVLYNLVNKNLTLLYALNYRNNNIDQLLKYKNINNFIGQYHFTDTDMQAFIQQLKELGYPFNQSKLLSLKKDIGKYVRNALLSLIWNESDVTKVNYMNDDYIATSLKFKD